MDHSPSWSIGELAAAAGMHVESVRYYQRLRLLATPSKPYGGIRRYGEAALRRLCFIKAAQGLGFSLAEVADLLRLEDGLHCSEARDLAERKLTAIRSKLAALQSMEASLHQAVQACRAAVDRPNQVRCPLIATLQHETATH